jgi:hypothetical protein
MRTGLDESQVITTTLSARFFSYRHCIGWACATMSVGFVRTATISVGLATMSVVMILVVV